MELILTLLILVFSAILHEIAHGYVAERLGDPTARLLGRLTLNPKSHIDPFMTILLPLSLFLSGSPILFGGAKPVPVDPFNLRDGRKDMALVAVAGPLTNIMLAVISGLLMKLMLLIGAAPNETTGFLLGFTYFALLKIVEINLLLAIFNLIPLPPLDGSKVFTLLLPEKEAAAFLSIGNAGIIILMLLLFMPIGGFSLGGAMHTLLLFFENLLIP